MYEYFGNEDYIELPTDLSSPTRLQSRLLFFLSDIVKVLSKTDGGEKYQDLSMFIKAELVVWLAQLFRILVQDYRKNQCEEDFVKIVWDHDKIIVPQLEARRNYLLNPPLKKQT